MARAGGGGGGGRSGGGHSSARSSGGHRMGGSFSGGSRPGSGFGGSRPGGGFGGGPGGPGGPMHQPPRRSGYRGPVWHMGGPPHGPYYGRPARRGGCGCGSTFAILFFILVLVIVFSTPGESGSGIPESTANREKISSGVAYQNNCITDELGWFDSTSRTAKKLQDFYEATGVQPYIYLRAYDASLTTDSEKLAFAENWYEENIDNESTFLYIYFAEQDQDYDVGYMCYVNGKQVTAVMDAEAVDIFWAYLDNAWYSDLSTDDMFVTVFNNTADRIMGKSENDGGALKWIVIFAVAVVLVVVIVKKKKDGRQDETGVGAEAERILDEMNLNEDQN